MSSLLECPNCKHGLPNKLSLIIKSAKNNSTVSDTGDVKKLPCPYCNYELIDINKLRKWAVVTLVVFLPLGIILGYRSNGLLFIIPILLVLFVYAVVTVPIKTKVFKNKKA